MIDVPVNLKPLAITKIQEIVNQAVDISADKVTTEFAKEGGLEVFLWSEIQVSGESLLTRHLKKRSWD
jgi:hypothetical protein